MKAKIVLLLLLLPFIVFSQITAKVVGVKDGDTVVVLDSNNVQTTLRLAEVDCPESGQPFGKNAKQFTSDQVFGKMVKYIATDVDRYGRTIAKIYYGNKYLSEELIKNGLGWWYYRYSTDKNLGILQNKAEEQKLGLWSDKNAVAPWDWRMNRSNN